MPKMLNSISRLIDRKTASLPHKAYVAKVDQNVADISFGVGSGIVRNVRIQGDPEGIEPGMIVFVQWLERSGGYLAPVIVSVGGEHTSSGYTPQSIKVDNSSIENDNGTLKIKSGGIKLSHLSFTPSLEGHIHPNPLTDSGWNIIPGSIMSYEGNLALYGEGSIIIGRYEDSIRIDANNATYYLWAGAVEPEDAVFKVGIDGKIYASGGAISGWNIGGDQFDADNGNAILNSDIPFLGLGGATSFWQAGIWMGKDSGDGLYKVFIGNPEGTYLYWDGCSLSVKGFISASGGDIAGWSIEQGYLYSGDDSYYVGLSSDVAEEYAFWAGSVLGGDAPFSVTKTGQIVAASGVIGGWVLGPSTLGAGGETHDIVLLDAADPSISIGGLEGYLSGAGFWVGAEDSVIKMHVGNPTTNFLAWDGCNLIVTGAIMQAEETLGVIGGWTMIAHDQGQFAMDILVSQTKIDFRKTMTPNDFIWIQARDADTGNIRKEFMKVLTLDSGTTYNVQRGLDNGGVGFGWPANTIYAVLGNTGDGRLEFDAYNSPRISIKTQGNAYNVNTEIVRLGDLTSWQTAGLTGYGMALGDYAGNKYLYYSPTSGLVVRGNVTADSGSLGTLSVNGTLTVGAAGKIVLNGETTGIVIGYLTDGYYIRGKNNGATQFEIKASDGKLYAGGGDVIVDENGVRLLVESGHFETNTIRWVDHADPDDVYYTLGMRISGSVGDYYLQNAQLVEAPLGYGASWMATATASDTEKIAQVYLGTAACDGENEYTGSINLWSDPVNGEVCLAIGAGLIDTGGKLYHYGGLRVTNTQNHGPGNDFGEIYDGAIVADKMVYSQSLDITSGWSSIQHTWTYASTTTFTVAGDLRDLYQAGTKLRWKEGATQKFANVLSSSFSSPNTTVTIFPSVDYGFTNTTYTDKYFSKAENPESWPDWFTTINNSNQVGRWTCSSGNQPSIGNGVILFRYRVHGKTIHLQGYLVGGSTTTYGNGGNWNFTLPATAEAGTLGNWLGDAHCRNQGQSWFRCVQISPGASIIQYFFDPHAGTNTNFLTNTIPCTWNQGNLQFNIFYRYA